MMRYISTRGAAPDVDFTGALLGGLAPDGGLYVPQHFPDLYTKNLHGKSYAEVAFAVMQPFVAGCIRDGRLRAILEKIYAPGRFADAKIMPVRPLLPGLYLMEQFHGPTLAFKDAALQLLGALFDEALTGTHKKMTIIGATSGDTGSAAIEGCKDCQNVRVFILYPEGRVSEVQRRQMTTVAAPHVFTAGIDGSFDDCQTLIKAMFADESFRRDMQLSAVNSINWARIMAQMVYYFTASLSFDRPVSFIVPTGNFGNVLAGYYARAMGANIDRLIIASNRNDILTRFFESGVMQAESVIPTISPSMDIQVSSNFERYLYALLDQDAQKIAAFMTEFKATGRFAVDPAAWTRAQKDFMAVRASEEETMQTMRRIFEETGTALDPHTAVGVSAALKNPGDQPVIALATAHPAKFPDAVERAAGQRPALPPHLADLMDRREHLNALPNSLSDVMSFIRARA